MSLSSVDMSALLQTLSQNGLRIEQLTITATYGSAPRFDPDDL